MHAFNLKNEEKFDPQKHVERVLGRVGVSASRAAAR